MASQSGEPHELNFTGESAEEAEGFIQAVNKRAYAAGRQKDNAWIAEFAYPLFSKKALRWYETLDDETQNDWKLLKRAILVEFAAGPLAPATVPSAASAVVSSPSNNPPAAPPPSGVTVKIGRIRVNSEDPTKSGYISISNERGLGTVLADYSRADIFEVDAWGRTFRFQGSEENLVIRGSSKNWHLTPRTEHYGYLLESSINYGTQWNHTWSIAGDGKVTAVLLRTDGSQRDAEFMVNTYTSAATDYILVPADKDAFLEKFKDLVRPITLFFEPVS